MNMITFFLLCFFLNKLQLTFKVCLKFYIRFIRYVSENIFNSIKTCFFI